jgi:hypothetical protein
MATVAMRRVVAGTARVTMGGRGVGWSLAHVSATPSADHLHHAQPKYPTVARQVHQRRPSMQCIMQSFLSLSTAHAHPASPPCRVPLNSPPPHKTCTSCACVRRSATHPPCHPLHLPVTCMNAAKVTLSTCTHPARPPSICETTRAVRAHSLHKKSTRVYVLFFFACVGASSAPIQYICTRTPLHT